MGGLQPPRQRAGLAAGPAGAEAVPGDRHVGEGGQVLTVHDHLGVGDVPSRIARAAREAAGKELQPPGVSSASPASEAPAQELDALPIREVVSSRTASPGRWSRGQGLVGRVPAAAPPAAARALGLHGHGRPRRSDPASRARRRVAVREAWRQSCRQVKRVAPVLRVALMQCSAAEAWRPVLQRP